MQIRGGEKREGCFVKFVKCMSLYVVLSYTLNIYVKKKKIRRPDLLFPIKQTWLRDQPNLKISKKIMSQKGHLSS